MRARARRFTVGILIVTAAPAAAVYGFSALRRHAPAFDPSRLVPVERGTKVVSVVATGKIEPVTKVDITSKANGVIERVLVDVGDLVRR